jgi:hypothetical protein
MMNERMNRLLSIRNVFSLALILALAVAPSALSAQDRPDAQKQEEKKEPEKEKTLPSAKELKKAGRDQEKAPQMTPVEALAELVIIAYGGRDQLKKVRAAIQEEGTIRLNSDQGDISGTYVIRAMRKEKTWLNLMRTDLDLIPSEAARRQGAASSIKYTIAYNGASVWSAQNNQYITPRQEASAAYRAQLTHDYTALLYYKEDGSKMELKDPETIVGVQTNVVDLTTTEGEKTRFWISRNTLRILHLEYELKLVEDQPAVKYRVSFFYTPPRVIQNTLVPSRRVMMQDGKFAQEMTLTSAQYSAKLDPEIFQHLQIQ